MLSKVNRVCFFRTGSAVAFDHIASANDRDLILQVSELLGPNTYQEHVLTDGRSLRIAAPYDSSGELSVHLFDSGHCADLSEVNFLRSTNFPQKRHVTGAAANSLQDFSHALAAAKEANKLETTMVQNILVTGSSGTIGSEVVSALINCGYTVLGVDLNRCRFNPHVDRFTVTGDLRHSDTYEKVLQRMQKIDLILHLAAEPEVHRSVLDPSLAKKSLDTHWEVMEFARKHSIPVGFASSREVYGKQPRTLIPEHAAPFRDAESPYTLAKLCGENLMQTYNKCYQLPFTIFRYSNVYGPNENRSSRVMCVWTRAALKGDPITVFGCQDDEDKAYSFTHISDAVSGTVAIARAMRAPHLKGQTFNICGPTAVPLKDLALLIQEVVNQDQKSASAGTINIVPNRAGEINWFHGDWSKLNSAVGYEPHVGFKDGMREAVQGYKTFIQRGLDPVWESQSNSRASPGLPYMFLNILRRLFNF